MTEPHDESPDPAAPSVPGPVPTGPGPDEDAPVTEVDFARATAGQLLRLASPVQAGLILLGGLLALSKSPEAFRPGAPAAVMAGLVSGVGLALFVGLAAGHLLRGFGALLLVQAEQADAAGRLARTWADRPDRPVATSAAGAPAQSPTPADTTLADLAAIRAAIRGGRWAEADTLVLAFADARPDEPESARIADELRTARQAAAEDLLARIEVAREVNDPDRVLELRDEVKPLLDHEPLRSLDRDLGRWFMILIQKRLRAGTVRADVALLAGRVAASLDDTPEGASLRASLPTLRRAAGLCPRCAEPYLGTAGACPACVAAARVAGPTAQPTVPPPGTDASPPSNGTPPPTP